MSIFQDFSKCLLYKVDIVVALYKGAPFSLTDYCIQQGHLGGMGPEGEPGIPGYGVCFLQIQVHIHPKVSLWCSNFKYHRDLYLDYTNIFWKARYSCMFIWCVCLFRNVSLKQGCLVFVSLLTSGVLPQTLNGCLSNVSHPF